MSSSDFTQRRRREYQVQAAAVAEDEQHGSNGHRKEERAETADEMLDRFLISQGQDHIDPQIMDGEGRCQSTD